MLFFPPFKTGSIVLLFIFKKELKSSRYHGVAQKELVGCRWTERSHGSAGEQYRSTVKTNKSSWKRGRHFIRPTDSVPFECVLMDNDCHLIFCAAFKKGDRHVRWEHLNYKKSMEQMFQWPFHLSVSKAISAETKQTMLKLLFNKDPRFLQSGPSCSCGFLP